MKTSLFFNIGSFMAASSSSRAWSIKGVLLKVLFIPISLLEAKKLRLSLFTFSQISQGISVFNFPIPLPQKDGVF